MRNRAVNDPDDLRDPDDWRTRAACRGIDPELFFGTGTNKRIDRTRERDAKAICEGCNTRVECLAEALSNDEEYGIWGGMNADERRSVARRLREAG